MPDKPKRHSRPERPQPGPAKPKPPKRGPAKPGVTIAPPLKKGAPDVRISTTE